MVALVAYVPPVLTVGRAFSAWRFAPALSAGLVAAVALYAYGVVLVGRRDRGRHWPATHTGAFVVGLAVVAVATQSSVAVYDDVLFSAHMVQHLLLIMVAPPLLVWGRPVTLLLHASRNPTHTRVKRLVRSRVVTAVTWPPATAVAYAAVVAVTHLTPFMNEVLVNRTVHDLEHVLYLLVGYLYFLPLIGSEPIRWRVAAPGRFVLLLVTMPVDTAVGVTLMLSTHEWFPAYLHQDRRWGPSPLTDLHTGGTVMWIGSDVIMTAIALWLAVVFARDRRGAGGTLGHWVDGIRASSLRRGLDEAGLATPARLAAHTIDSDAHVEAYNAYLASLVPGERPRRRDVRQGRRPARRR